MYFFGGYPNMRHTTCSPFRGMRKFFLQKSKRKEIQGWLSLTSLVYLQRLVVKFDRWELSWVPLSFMPPNLLPIGRDLGQLLVDFPPCGMSITTNDSVSLIAQRSAHRRKWNNRLWTLFAFIAANWQRAYEILLFRVINILKLTKQDFQLFLGDFKTLIKSRFHIVWQR